MRKILLLLLVVLLANTTLFAQNTCNAPTAISSLPFSSGTQTTCGTVDDYPVGSYYTGNYGGGEDYVYSLSITNAPVTLKFDLAGAATWKILSIHSGCTPTTANAIGGCTTSSGTTGTVTLNITTNGTYYLFVDTWPTPTCGEFTLNVSVIPPCSTPSAQPSGLNLTPTTNSVAGSFTAASPAPTNYLVVRTTTNTAPVPANGTTYTVGNNAIGYIESVGTGTTFTSTGLLPSTTYYYWVFAYNSTSGTCTPVYLTTSPLTASASTLTAGTITSTSRGGLWSSTATWVGGVVPNSGDNVTIADGATVTIDGTYSAYSLTVGQGTSGVLNWNATSYALTVVGNITINSGAKLLAYTTAGTGQTINVGGNFINNGYVNLAAGTTAGAGALLNFNGSQQSSSLNQTLGGTGTFEGNGTSGIIRALFFQTTGSSTISTTQNLITTSFAHTAGSLNTNGKLTIDNSVNVYGRPINTQVASVAVTTMSTTAYTNAPVVFGASVSLWTAGGAATLNTRYFSGNNVYIATTAGTFDASTAPTHTSGSVTNGTVPLLWIGTLGTIGNPFQQTAVTAGTQYFYGSNLYVCTVAGTPSAAAPPTHTSGTAVSGTATFLYVGTPATVTVNYDGTAQNVRSLNLTNSGSGYSSAPTITFSLNGGTGAGASATAVVFQSIAYGTNSLTQASGGTTITGGLNINSTAGASAFSGVAGLFTTGGGVGYTVAPTVGFAGPTNINLVTNPGSGYTTAPTITVTGGTLVSGTALTSSNFTITVANGQVVSVYLNTATTATYSVPPTLAFSAGNATLAFPTGCWPAATANIGANGQITSFTITNAGFGYVAAPTVGFGATSGTATGGTFITAATAPTARVALYNITYGWFTPAPASAQNTISSIIPTNGKANAITVNSSTGASFASSLELFSATPLTLTNGVLDFGSNTLTLSNYAYAGASGSTTSNVSGRIVLTSPGGSVTRTFPYDAGVAVATGTGSLGTGSSVTTITASRTAAPTGTINGGIASLTGSRSYRVQANTGSVYGTAPTVTLNYNATDALTTVNNADLLIVQSAAVTGAWTVRSVSSGTGALSATGSRTTATSGAGPIVPTGDDYFAWATSLPCAGTPTTGVITGSTDACVGGTISYTSSTFSSGNGMTYRWQTSATGSDPWVNTTVTIPTAYSQVYSGPVWIRRVDTCNNSGQIAISNVIQVTSRAATLCYCGPNTGTTIHSSTSNSIDNVTITGTTLNNSSIGVGNTSTGYIEFPASGSTTATLLQGTNYNLSTSFPSASMGSVWIDFNRNGTYEASEWTLITTSGSGVINTNIAIPVNASLGVTGMRIRTRGTGNTNGSGDACTSFGSGETEEYYITISAPPSCSGTPTAGTIAGPTGSVCAGSNVTLTATGYTNGVAGITYRWQSSTTGSDPWVNTTGTNPASFTTAVSANTWFRLVDTCTNGNAFAVSSNTVQVTVASVATVPYNQGFESITADNTLPGCMAATSLGSQNLTYASLPTTTLYGRNPRSGTKFAAFKWNPGAAGHWFFTDPIQLTGGVAYDAHVWYVTDGASGFDSLNIAYGTSASALAMGTTRIATKLAPTNTTYQNLMGTFTPPTTGVYVIGYQVTGTSSTPWYVTIDDIAVVASGTFPVTFTTFKGERKGTENLLSWTTATETNNAGFELQRSADGVNFSPLVFVDSKAPNGNSTQPLSYNFTDVKPLAGSGYYRLKQVDKDGKSSFSEVVLIKGLKPTKLELVSVYPNPVINTLKVSIAATKADKVTFIVSDITGKAIVTQVMNILSGDNTLQIDVNNLAKGTYTIKAICADGCETAIRKFVKQ